MEKIEFNKKLFIRNDDDAFKIAVMFTRYGQIPKSYQEVLFFANKDIVKGGVNFLAFTEMYNETISYVDNWILGLDALKDEFDWEFHRSKLLTRFLTQKRIQYESVYEELGKTYESTANILRNALILWSNGICWAEESSYKHTASPKLWELWDILVKYREGLLEEIKGSEKHHKEFQKLIKYRNTNEFYKDRQERLIDHPDLFKEVEKIEKDLEIIFFKDKLSKEIPIISAIKKRLKI